MPELVNASTSLPEEVAPEDVGRAFFSGTHNFNADKPAYVLNPQGDVEEVNPADVYNAVTQGGYSFPTKTELKNHEMQKRYGNEPLKAALLGAANTATLGGFGQAAKTVGAIYPQTLEQLPKQNPGATLLGSLAAVPASLAALPEGGPIGLIGEAGQGVSEALMAPEAAGAARAALQNIGAKTIGGAVEGAAFEGGQQVNEHLLGDPQDTGEEVLANIGQGALYGGGVGAALGIGSEILGPLVKNAVGAIRGEVSKVNPSPLETAAGKAASGAGETAGAIAPEFSGTATGTGTIETPQTSYDSGAQISGNGDTLEKSIDAMNLSEQKKQGLIEGLGQLKKNSDEIVAAANDIGAPVMESMISDNKTIQNLDSQLMQSPTAIGQARARVAKQVFEAAQKVADSALGAPTVLSDAEVGNSLKKIITERVEAEKGPISALYDSIKEQHELIPLSEKSQAAVARNMRNIEGLHLVPSSPEAQLAETIAAGVERAKTVEDVKQLNSIVGRMTKGHPDLAHVASVLSQKLDDMETNSILRFAEQNFQEGSPGQQRVLDILKTRTEADAKYRDFMEKIGEIGNVSGKKKIYGPRDFLNYFQDLTPEDVAKKLFAKKNSEFLDFFSKEFPDGFKLISDLEKTRIRNAATKDSVLNFNTVNKEINNLSPEAKRLFFSDYDLNKLKSAQTVMEAFPKNVNPSGTDISAGLRRFVSNPLSSTISTAMDWATQKGIKAIVPQAGTPEEVQRISSLIAIEKAAQKTRNQIDKAVSYLSSNKEDIQTGLIQAGILGKAYLKRDKDEQQEQFDKRKEAISAHSSQEQMLHTLQKSTGDLYSYAPQSSQAIQMGIIRRHQFLQSKLPGPTVRRPLSGEYVPSQSEVSKFNHYYDIVEKPSRALGELAMGTLSPDSVEVLQTVYPRFYASAQQAIVQELSTLKDALPYQKRLALSLFMGQDMDESTIGPSIAANQMAFNGPDQKGQTITGGVKSTQKGLSALNVAERTRTPGQILSDRADA